VGSLKGGIPKGGGGIYYLQRQEGKHEKGGLEAQEAILEGESARKTGLTRRSEANNGGGIAGRLFSKGAGDLHGAAKKQERAREYWLKGDDTKVKGGPCKHCYELSWKGQPKALEGKKDIGEKRGKKGVTREKAP